MHSFQGKTATFHYDGALDGDIIIIDKDGNEVRFEVKDIIELFTEEGIMGQDKWLLLEYIIKLTYKNGLNWCRNCDIF